MSNKKIKISDNVQLELFQTSKNLNLSETYEIIPKDVSINDKGIEWISDKVANPITKTFSIEGIEYFSEITPAMLKDKKGGGYKTMFPDNRESRIEYALISLASKENIDEDTDKKNNKIFVLKTTYYQIQKEIVEAINITEGKNISVNECPYNTTDIKEALEILKATTIRVKNENGEGQYIFNRIKDIYLDDKKVVIELGNMITNYISSGDWKATDKNSILASKGKYERKLRVLLNLKFRYASGMTHFNPSLEYLIKHLDFVESKEKRITLQKMTKLIESLREVEKVEVEKKYEGRKIVNAIYTIYPSKKFISLMIQNNKDTKVKDNILINEKGEVLLEPKKEDYTNKEEYYADLYAYNKEKGKSLLRWRKNIFNEK